jgi:hypothetical protein
LAAVGIQYVRWREFDVQVVYEVAVTEQGRAIRKAGWAKKAIQDLVIEDFRVIGPRLRV